MEVQTQHLGNFLIYVIKAMKSPIALFLVLLYISSCNSDDSEVPTSSICDALTIINANRFNNTSTENYTILNATISGDCIEIELSSGGCDGNTWGVELIDSGGIAESLPEQRFLVLDLDNTELCDAIVIRSYTFELTPLQIDSEEILLNLATFEGQLSYRY
ncbi:MAG: hypothetical protein AAGB24_04620 [Bacteroidota bacterium]